MPAPPNGGKPGPRTHHGRTAWDAAYRLAPAVEPCCRRAGIDGRFSGMVLVAVHQHVDERVPHHTGRGQGTSVIPVTPNGATPTKCTVDRPCDANGESPEPAHQGWCIVRLDDQM